MPASGISRAATARPVAAHLLASGQARFVTGAGITVDGGMTGAATEPGRRGA